MRKVLFFFLLHSLLATLVCAQNNEVALDSRYSVAFFAKPQEIQQYNTPVLTGTLDPARRITAMATAIDATQFGVDSAMIATNYDNSFFVDMILQYITAPYAGMQVITKKKIAKEQLLGYEVILNNESPTDNMPYKDIHAKVFFGGAQVYVLTVLTPEGISAVAEKADFFNSFKVTD